MKIITKLVNKTEPEKVLKWKTEKTNKKTIQIMKLTENNLFSLVQGKNDIFRTTIFVITIFFLLTVV